MVNKIKTAKIKNTHKCVCDNSEIMILINHYVQKIIIKLFIKT